MSAAVTAKSALARLARAEALTEEAQRIAGVGTWQFDTASGLVVWSAELFRIFGVSPATFQPSLDTFIAAVHPDDRDAMLGVVAATMAGQPMDFVHRIIRPDGEERWVHDRAQVVVLEISGQPIMVGTVQDITERKNAEDLILQQSSRLEELQAELIYMARQSAMGTMATTLAHEINQPLTAIRNYAAGLRPLISHVPEAREGLEQLERNAARAGDVIRHLREMTRSGPTKQRLANLRRIIKDAAELVTKDACPAVDLEYRIAASAPVDADPVQIGQVIVNLVKNACEAVANAPTKKIVISSDYEGSAIRVDVTDSGGGIAPALLARLFDRVQSTKPQGMGLGLSICRTIIESHGGQIGADNLREGGAHFWFTLPGPNGEAPAVDAREV